MRLNIHFFAGIIVGYITSMLAISGYFDDQSEAPRWAEVKVNFETKYDYYSRAVSAGQSLRAFKEINLSDGTVMEINDLGLY